MKQESERSINFARFARSRYPNSGNHFKSQFWSLLEGSKGYLNRDPNSLYYSVWSIELEPLKTYLSFKSLDKKNIIKKYYKNDILIKMDQDKIITIVIIAVAIIIVLATFSGLWWWPIKISWWNKIIKILQKIKFYFLNFNSINL